MSANPDRPTWQVASSILLPTPELTILRVDNERVNEEELLIELHRTWTQIGTHHWRGMFEPQVLVLDFTAVQQLPEEFVSNIYAFYQPVLSGTIKPTYAVYDGLNRDVLATLQVGFSEAHQVVVARMKDQKDPTLIGYMPRRDRYLEAFHELVRVKQWVDGGPFSSEVLGREGRNRTELLNRMSKEGIVIKAPQWLPNRSHYRAVMP